MDLKYSPEKAKGPRIHRSHGADRVPQSIYTLIMGQIVLQVNSNIMEFIK